METLFQRACIRERGSRIWVMLSGQSTRSPISYDFATSLMSTCVQKMVGASSAVQRLKILYVTWILNISPNSPVKFNNLNKLRPKCSPAHHIMDAYTVRLITQIWPSALHTHTYIYQWSPHKVCPGYPGSMRSCLRYVPLFVTGS